MRSKSGHVVGGILCRYENPGNRALSDEESVRVTASKPLRPFLFLHSTVLLLGCNILPKLCPLEDRNATKDGRFWLPYLVPTCGWLSQHQPAPFERPKIVAKVPTHKSGHLGSLFVSPRICPHSGVFARQGAQLMGSNRPLFWGGDLASKIASIGG